MSIEEKLKAVAENEEKVFEAGKQNGFKEWWRLFQDNGNRNHYVYAFSHLYWNDQVYDPIYPIIAQTYGLNNTFLNSYITDTKVPISVYGSMNASFTNSSIETINKLILKDVTSANNPFGGCKYLKNIIIEGKILISLSFSSCPLSVKSIVSVVEALSETASGQTLTLQKAAVDIMQFPFTSEQSGSTYNSWDELIASKSTWNISLM